VAAVTLEQEEGGDSIPHHVIPGFYSSTPMSSDAIKLLLMQPPSALPYAPLSSRRMVSFCAILS
jgi:hypothetical protein